jgi:hypothetical protein
MLAVMKQALQGEHEAGVIADEAHAVSVPLRSLDNIIDY